MRINSSRRISKRRQGALVRRMSDVKNWAGFPLNGLGETGVATIKHKLETAKKDVENLQKKGVRA
jgi:hypothetical protein